VLVQQAGAKPMRRWITWSAAGAAVLLVGVVLYRTLQFSGAEPPPAALPSVALDSVAILNRFAESLRYRTISHQDTTRVEAEEFQRFHAFLQSAFPRVHQQLELQRIGYSLLYRWRGRDSTKPAALLMGHMDVVPVEPETESQWRYPPFSGTIADGYVWGRGAIDDKISVMSVLEAVEALLAQGFQPPYDLYLAFGHDEEVGGQRGAAQIARLLQQRGVRLRWVLDEGGAVTTGMFPGVERPLAMVGIAEKGYMMVELSVEGSGGHSSVPPRETPLGILARAIVTVERSPMPARLTSVAQHMLEAIAPEMSFWQRLVVANRWLFGNLLLRQLQQTPRGNALLRTTFAPTIFQAGIKENVIPARVHALVNVRLLPGDTPEQVLEYLRQILPDRRIQIRQHSLLSLPSPVTDPSSPAFQAVARSIRAVFPEARVVPYLVLGATDSRHYTGLTSTILRFTPVRLTPEEYATFHGTNERIPVREVLRAVRFFVTLLQQLD
jgi:carboxypeptidase PM20D1